MYHKFKMKFDKGKKIAFGNNEINKLFLNYIKFIQYLENIKNIMIKIIEAKNLYHLSLIIKLIIETIDKNENPFKNICCEYTLANPILFKNINNHSYKENNILNNEKYEQFELFINDIIMLIYDINLNSIEKQQNSFSELPNTLINVNGIEKQQNSFSELSNTLINVNSIEKQQNSFSKFTFTSGLNSNRGNINDNLIFLRFKILSLIDIINTHKVSAEFIKELSDGTFISGGFDGKVFFLIKILLK